MGERTSRRSPLLVVGLCFGVILFDGYDLLVFGASVPSLLEEPGWGLTPARVGAIASYALVGIAIGALGAGVLSGRFGHRRLLMVGLAWFSVAMVACAVAADPTTLGVLRFLAGLGLGAVVPSALALTVEYVPGHRRQFFSVLVLSGYAFGGVLAAVAALALVADHGWRVLVALGAVPLVVLLPLIWWLMPESAAYLRAVGRTEEAGRVARAFGVALVEAPVGNGAAPTAAPTGFSAIFGRRWIVSTLLFGLASFCCLLLIYGLNTWLPQIMRAAGYPLGSALTFLLVLNLGAVVGSLLSSALADRFGPKTITAVSFVVAVAALIVLSAVTDSFVVLMLAVAAAGWGGSGTLALVNSYVATHYTPTLRGAAVGWSVGVGRAGAIIGPLFGAWVLSVNLGPRWAFYGFAVAPLIGGVGVLAVPGRRSTPHQDTGTQLSGPVLKPGPRA